MKDSSKEKYEPKKPAAKLELKFPKMSGSFLLIAKKGISLPLRYVDQDLVKVTCEKSQELNWESLPYESKISIKKAYAQGHVKLVEAAKGDK